MPAGNFSFRFAGATGRPSGWTAQTISSPQPVKMPSSIGSVNALAQNPVSATSLMTTPQTLSDPTLGSRAYQNANTGVRLPVASGSVYAMGDVPAYLSQAVAGLNDEQSLRRALQAEWNNKIFGQATSGADDAYLWQEAIRAASVSPGSSVSFGAQVPTPPRLIPPTVLIGGGTGGGGGGSVAIAPLTVQQQIARSAADAAAANAWRNSASPVNYSPMGIPLLTSADTTRRTASGWAASPWG